MQHCSDKATAVSEFILKWRRMSHGQRS